MKSKTVNFKVGQKVKLIDNSGMIGDIGDIGIIKRVSLFFLVINWLYPIKDARDMAYFSLRFVPIPEKNKQLLFNFYYE